MPPISDRELIAAVRRGQVDAFATLIGRHRDLHTRYAIRMLGGYIAADDALQAAFARAYRSLAKCKDPEQFGEWLSRIVVNEVRSCAMRRTVRASRSTGEMAAIVAGPEPGSDPAAEVQRALDALDPINREAFVLQYIEQLSYGEISALTGTPVPALEARVDRACARLRELLARMYAEHRQAVASTHGDPLDPGMPFVARIAAPLRKTEVLNDTFDDRLMGKLLGPAEAVDPPSGPTMESTVTSAAQVESSSAGDAVMTRDLRSLSPRTMGVVAAVIVGAFASGYLVNGGRADPPPTPQPAPAPAAKPVVITRVDTVRVVRRDTVHLVRFVYADPAAKSVTLAGDFNEWSTKATPLTRATPKAVWSATLPLSTGRHKYAFVVDGKRRPTDSLSTSATAPTQASDPSVALAGAPATKAASTKGAAGKTAGTKTPTTKPASTKTTGTRPAPKRPASAKPPATRR